MGIELQRVKPFEICSIRPPTENSSLTFRLTRNCYWNRCAFCPVYKYGARFSRRDIGEVLEDIRRAKLIDDLMFEHSIGVVSHGGDEFARADELAAAVERACREAGEDGAGRPEMTSADIDPRLAWFHSWFKDSPDMTHAFRHVLSWRIVGGRTCFFGDADSLILNPDFLRRVIDHVKLSFPSVQRFTVYGRTATAAGKRSTADLEAFREAGLDRVHFGLESGCDAVLSLVNKGVSSQEHAEGFLKTREAGLSCSAYVMPGLGGKSLSEEHAADTARLITRIIPDFVRLRTLEIFPNTPLEEKAKAGEFIEADEEQVVREIRTLVEEIDCRTVLMSDSATNLLDVQGRLPEDRKNMLAEIERYLGLDARGKLEFSLRSRISSFYGQYGGLTADIYREVGPYLRQEGLDFTRASDDDLRRGIVVIREKLMP
ncbi:MAG TPA: radical SAM protein [Deltaproteobacteria bacterium]|nr:radical SAM protein [Deltaproteobacteria bacterium]